MELQTGVKPVDSSCDSYAGSWQQQLPASLTSGDIGWLSVQLIQPVNYNSAHYLPSTYDHRVWKIGLPVRSAVLKPHAGELVVGWVTTSESSLLYVFVFALFYLPLRMGYHY
ncbi:L-lysine 2-3-aminomutase [Penicillium bovifimosum]|uniref:L-lysine 2-3-aminomutase n=1 Tax=Penicillium bovifimosum TaxID=126998 RepID=A0A9W9H533_9EURO|nr:L-lysine 2-3-aminomutase [Penicillium bovifimosum]KAJ5138774.1 L-lysine 2-3-aminomutase [Penicillium bovifimosum]